MPKLFVKTYGCTLNKKDTETVINDNEFTTDLKEAKKANYILINTCGVKEQTQRSILNFLKQLKEEKIDEKKIIIFGCLVDIDKQAMLEILPNARYFKVSEKKKIEKIIGKGKKIKKEKSTSRTIILSNGCLGDCYYCAVKFARGRLESRPIKEIVSEIKKELENPEVKEIVLTSQDNACYGLDINENLVKLLKKIIKIKKDFKIKIGMGNPQYLKNILKDLIEVYKDPKVYKFIHIPLQSGDDKVLREMNRYYTVEDVKRIINAFRKEFPDISIATDIIVGYPTETENQFENTLKVIKEINFDFINISRYGTRKNIEALRYKDLSGTIKKERSRKITTIFENIVFIKNKGFIGQEKEILITEIGKKNSFVGKNDEYRSVVVKATLKIGQKLKVKIINAEKYYLLGEIVNPK